MILSQKKFVELLEFAATTENENVLEFSLNGNEFAAKTENEKLSEIFLNWSENAANTENDIVFKYTCRIRNNFRLRQKMMFSLYKFVVFD